MDIDEFADDDFEELNANALQELENKAIQWTQAIKKSALSQSQLVEILDDDFDDDDLDDLSDHAAKAQRQLRPGGGPMLAPGKGTAVANSPTSVPRHAEAPSPRLQGMMPSQSLFHRRAIDPTGRTPGNGHGLGRGAQHGQGPSQESRHPQAVWPGPGHSLARPQNKIPLPRPAPARFQPSQVPRISSQRSGGPPPQQQVALQAKLEELELKLATKEGEISIIRSRLEKSKAENERELQTLKKQTAEESAKHAREVEATKAAQKTLAAELEFTRRDLKDELDRAKRKDREKVGGTPKKIPAAKSWGVADGFDDIEMAGSPPKGQRSNGAVASVMPEATRTPTKPKRKRPMLDSPVMALETTEDVDMMPVEAPMPDPPKEFYTVVEPSKPASFDFVKVILNHSAAHGRSLAFDFLSGFALPSNPTDSLAAILFQRLANIDGTNDPMRLPIEFCEQVIDLWGKCFREHCLAPITELASLVSLTIQLHTVAVAPHIALHLIPVAVESCFEVAVMRFQSSTGQPTSDSFKELSADLDTGRILSLLYLTALGCAVAPTSQSNPIKDFWSSMQVEFLLMMLSQKHPIDDFVGVLKLLCTSVFEDSIGPRNHASRTPDAIASAVIERVSTLLVETPRWNISSEKLRYVRGCIISTLAAFTRSTFGVLKLAENDYAIPRLVIFLCSSIDELYDGDVASMHTLLAPISPSPEAEGKRAAKAATETSPPDQLQIVIAHTTLLLHTIVMDSRSKDTLKVSEKLARFLGGGQRYLLSLARLNFSEEGMLGVNEDTAELAHELLELAVTEEVGGELGLFFGGEDLSPSRD